MPVCKLLGDPEIKGGGGVGDFSRCSHPGLALNLLSICLRDHQ